MHRIRAFLAVSFAIWLSLAASVEAHEFEAEDAWLNTICAATTLTEQGLYRVQLPGTDLLIHGPDEGPAFSAEPKGDGSAPIGFLPWSQRRTPVCATDHYLHVLYVGPTPMHPDDRYEIRAAMEHSNALVSEEARRSGGEGADLKVLCNDSGNMRVTTVWSEESSFAGVVTAVREAGYD